LNHILEFTDDGSIKYTKLKLKVKNKTTNELSLKKVDRINLESTKNMTFVLRVSFLKKKNR